MAYIDWDQNFSVGNSVLDTQHRALVDIVNELHEAMNSGKGKEALAHVYDSLVEYVEMHFRTEELLFNASNYPEKKVHIREHKKMMEEAKEFKDMFDDGEKFLTLETLNLVKEWVVHHIKETDMGYREYI